MSVLTLSDVCIRGESGPIFEGLGVEIRAGEFCCIRTGVLDGSTTLLKCMAGMREPDAGRCLLNGRPYSTYSAAELPRQVSFCHEAGGLLSLFNVYENIVLPMVYHWDIEPDTVHDRVVSIANALQIGDCLERRVHELNDVQQRMANLARALLLESGMLLLDELQEGCREKGISIVMTTTAGDRTGFADRHFEIHDRGLRALGIDDE